MIRLPPQERDAARSISREAAPTSGGVAGGFFVYRGKPHGWPAIGARRKKKAKRERRPKCGARNRRGGLCARGPTPGSRRCHYHGGRVAKLAPGDPRRGGAPATTFLYRRHLDDEGKQAFDAAAVDAIDDEIRLAKANLDSAVKEWRADPRGGVIHSRGDSVIRERLWIDIVREHVETVRRLVEARARINPSGSTDTSGIDALMARIDAGEFEPGDEATKPGNRNGRGPDDEV